MAAYQRRQQRKRIVWGVGAAGVLLLLVAAVVTLASRPGATYEIDPADTAQVALGRQVYDAQCASCHGANLEGEANWQQASPDSLLKAPPHDETGHTWHHDDATLIDAVKRGGARLPANVGTSAMPAYEDVLSDEEIAAVLAYIKSTWPADIRAAQSGR